MSRAKDLLDLQNLEKTDRYRANRESLRKSQESSKQWRWVGFDATTGQGIVRSGSDERRGKVITNGAIVPGQLVDYNEVGGFGTIKSTPRAKPEPPPKPKKHVVKREIISAWALGTAPFAGGGLGVYLINLLSGERYFLVQIPGTIQPCTPDNPPPGSPPEPAPTDGGDRTYIHVWVQPGNNFQPAFQPPHCLINTPVPTRADTVITNTTVINLINPIDGTSWFYRSAAGVYSTIPIGNIARDWGVNSIATFSNSAAMPTPPVDVAMPVVSTGYVNYNNTTFLSPFISANMSTWVYASTACTPDPYNPNLNPGPNPNYNRQPPPVPPIANTHEMTLSLDDDGNPIAFIRHTPSCVNQGEWAFRRSYRVVEGQIRNYIGKLLDDWRYTVPSFACQNTFSADLFVNLDRSINMLWDIESGDRPATIESNAEPVDIPVKNRSYDPANSCATSLIKPIEVEGKVIEAGTTTYTITSIAVRKI